MRLCCVCSAQKHGLLRDASVPQKGNIETLLKKYALCGNENTQVMPCTHVVVMNKVFRCSANFAAMATPSARTKDPELVPSKDAAVLFDIQQGRAPHVAGSGTINLPERSSDGPTNILSAVWAARGDGHRRVWQDQVRW
jgi:hypothetical protein